MFQPLAPNMAIDCSLPNLKVMAGTIPATTRTTRRIKYPVVMHVRAERVTDRRASWGRACGGLAQ